MGGKSSRSKGQRGEREIIKLLQPTVNAAYIEAGRVPPILKRNLMQTMEGGYDISGIDWMALEVKRQEKLNLNSWWRQTLKQCKENQEPILIYRANRQPWRVRMKCCLTPGYERPLAVVDTSIDAFLTYFHLRIQKELSIC
jgi:hypothetical protein